MTPVRPPRPASSPDARPDPPATPRRNRTPAPAARGPALPPSLAAAAQAATALARAELDLQFDAWNPGSRPTPQQDAILRDIGRIQFRYVVAGNQSGKSTIPAREIAWIVRNGHPYGWKRPAQWTDAPLLIIVAGQSRQMMEVEMWGKKLKPLVDPDGTEWREVRQGGALTMVEHRTLGHQIIFISHADSSEKNRKLMQGYVAHYVWLDEMPASTAVLEELQRRVDARRGYFVATFTPKFKNLAIKKVVEAASEPLAKRYRLSKLDNPLYAASREAEIEKLKGYTDSYRNAVLFGDWMDGDDLIYEYSADSMGGTPDSYDRSWAHIAWVDPATESKLGLTVWAEDPATSVWWCVRAKYIERIYVPTKIIEAVERELVGLNIVKRGADSHETWFINQAAAMPADSSCANQEWIGIAGKTGNKDNFIRQFQKNLGTRMRIADWCEPAVEEIRSYERNPETGKIVKPSRFHILDTCHYMSWTLPEPRKTPTTYPNWESRVYAAARFYEQQEAERPELPGVRSGRARYVTPRISEEDAPLPLPPRPITPQVERVIRRRR